jgi:hypothetical protein
MSRDLHKYSRQTHFRLIIGGLLLIFVIGDGLILIFYGKNAALLGLLCLAGGLTPVVLIWLILLLMEWIANHVERG